MVELEHVTSDAVVKPCILQSNGDTHMSTNDIRFSTYLLYHGPRRLKQQNKIVTSFS